MASFTNSKAAIKVGFLTVVSFALLMATIIWLRGQNLGGGQEFTVEFSDVDGMQENAPVQMMGSRVGMVDEVLPVTERDGYKVQVKFRVNKEGIVVPRGSHLSIEQSGLFGEKFIEITPPRPLSVLLPPSKLINPDERFAATNRWPVQMLYQEGWATVGRVEQVFKDPDRRDGKVTLFYSLNKAGSAVPAKPAYELAQLSNDQIALRISSKTGSLEKAPSSSLYFTVDNPLRLKRFLDIQLESAEALRDTNQKINELLTDDTLKTLTRTVKNTEVLTARATQVLNAAERLFTATSRDMQALVTTSNQLTANITRLSDNLNEIIGDPKLKAELRSTVASIDQSSRTLNKLLQDPALTETLHSLNDTSQNASELFLTLRQTAQDPQLQQRLERTLTEMESSLTKLSETLETVQQFTTKEDDSLKAILSDLKTTTENTKAFSKKLGGRFTLFRLLF